jgi:hypothetical protein
MFSVDPSGAQMELLEISRLKCAGGAYIDTCSAEFRILNLVSLPPLRSSLCGGLRRSFPFTGNGWIFQVFEDHAITSRDRQGWRSNVL